MPRSASIVSTLKEVPQIVKIDSDYSTTSNYTLVFCKVPYSNAVQSVLFNLKWNKN